MKVTGGLRGPSWCRGSAGWSRAVRDDALEPGVDGRRAEDPRVARGLGTLCQTYWYPLYAYARRFGHGVEEAEDLVQAFFVRILEKQALQHADPERGRFRYPVHARDAGYCCRIAALRVAKMTIRSVSRRASDAFGTATPALKIAPRQTVIICRAAPYSSIAFPLR
jgi:hypothetical protein